MNFERQTHSRTCSKSTIISWSGITFSTNLPQKCNAISLFSLMSMFPLNISKKNVRILVRWKQIIRFLDRNKHTHLRGPPKMLIGRTTDLLSSLFHNAHALVCVNSVSPFYYRNLHEVALLSIRPIMFSFDSNSKVNKRSYANREKEGHIEMRKEKRQKHSKKGRKEKKKSDKRRKMKRKRQRKRR